VSALTTEELQAQIDASRKATAAFQAQLDARKAKSNAKAKEEAEDVRIASIVLAAMSKIPVPKDGKDGVDAQEVNYDVIQDFVRTAVDEIPKPKNGNNGKDGYTPIKGVDYHDGKPGANGKDFDEAIAEKLATKLISKTTAPVIEDIKKLAEASHEELISHADGKISELEGNLSNHIEKEITAKIWTPEDIDKAAAKHIESNAHKFKGKSIKGEQGPKGESIVGPAGKTPIKGIDYIDGKDGYTPIKGVDYHDGKEGPKGADGKPGKQGARGEVGKKGKDGKHGVGIKNIHTEGTALKISLTDGKVKTLVMPGARATGKVAPIAVPEVQNAVRTPIEAKGIAATNVRDALVEIQSKIVQSSAGNPFEAGTSEAFMYTFNPYDETHDGSFSYDSNDNLISKTIETHQGVTLYTVTFGYNGAQLDSKTIYSELDDDKVKVTYKYDAKGHLTGKEHTYIN